MSKKRVYRLKTLRETDHVCRHCGDGMVMESIGGGATGGGNPVYKCIACGETRCSILGWESMCYCGYEMPDGSRLYRCVRWSEVDDVDALLTDWDKWAQVGMLGVVKKRVNE